jgi:hypothetical protein
MPPCPSPEWEVLLEPFRPLFTQPGYRYFSAFVRVLAHLDRRLWVTQVILSRQIDRHFTSVYRFLREGAWSLTAVRHQLWTMCRQHCQGAGGRWFVVVDDTVCPKWGKRFFGLGWHHDPMNRPHPRKLSHGHCFVCLAGLAEQIPDHFVALFVGCALSLQEKTCQGKRKFATKLVLAARLACELALPPGQRLAVVADGAYARRVFVQALWAAGRHLVSRLRSDTVFYDLPPVRKKGKKGAPRKYGAKHKAREWAETKQRWREVSLRLYGRDVRVAIKSRVVIQRTLGVRVRVVAVRWEKRPVVFLFSTDTMLSAEEIVRVYCARFAIETGFRDAKQEFGLTTYQVRSERSIERLVHFCLWAQTLLRLVCWEAKSQAIYGEWRKPLGYLTLSQQKRLSQQQCRIVDGSHLGGRTDESATGLPLAA